MWPVIAHYEGAHLLRIALPLGGIGTGTVSLGGRGDLRDWEIVNRPAKGFMPQADHGREYPPFFALFVQQPAGSSITRLLEGPIDPTLYEGASGCTVANHGLPRFRHCAFDAAYPLGQVTLRDPQVPVQVRLDAFNPLIPGDADRSGLPVAVLRYVLTNPTDDELTVAICGNIPNFIGSDGTRVDLAPGKRNRFLRGKEVQGLLLEPGELDATLETWGTIALTTTADTGVSHRTAWATLTWGDSLLDFWDDFSSDGLLEARDGASPSPMAALAVRLQLPAHSERAVTFLLTWHFPNRQTWTPATADAGCGCAGGCVNENRIGNYYTTRCRDAWEAAEDVAAHLPALEADTERFVTAFCSSALPTVVKEAALFNLSTLRSQTTFRTPDGRVFGFEGCFDRGGCCHGSCTHVWNYEQALAFLFGDLALGMRDTEFALATNAQGRMSFRVNLPLTRATESAGAAADGQMGCLMKLYRDWQLSGNDATLRRLWPHAKRALEFCWIPGGWDADRDGVMEGCQHNTMDVEYYGPNPQMGGWYLGALRAMEEMGRYLGEESFADDCRALFTQGSVWLDTHLFNGDYYEQEIRPPLDAVVADALRIGMGAQSAADPELQLGAGCLVDQLVGQYMAHVCGLGYLLDAAQVRATLESIMRYNYRDDFSGHFNHLRSYVLGNEAGLLMATYPRGRRPQRPFPYYNEVMTGFEYSTAVHLLYEGQVASGLRVIEAIRARYDGRKRNPFDEAECGHHYARAMASWGAVLALTGFHYSAVTGTFRLSAGDGRTFWSTGYAWGVCTQTIVEDRLQAEVTVLYGTLPLSRVVLEGRGECLLPAFRRLTAGETVQLTVSRSGTANSSTSG